MLNAASGRFFGQLPPAAGGPGQAPDGGIRREIDGFEPAPARSWGVSFFFSAEA